MEIVANTKSKYSNLTRKQKMVADYMLENIEKMAFLTLKELSEEIGVSQVTILNTFNAIGFESFNEVKYECRKQLCLEEKINFYREMQTKSISVPAYEKRKQRDWLSGIVKDELRDIEEYISALDIREMFDAAELFTTHSKIVLCGRGVSKIIADYMAIRLTGLGIPSMVMNTELSDSIGMFLPLFDRQTLVVAISFPDYYSMTTKIAEMAVKKGCTVLAITDFKSAPIVQYGKMVLTAPSSTKMCANTLSSTMILVNILASALDIITSYRTDVNGEGEERFEQLFHD